MKKWILRIMMVLLPWLLLVGCAGLGIPNVLLTSCIIPPQLDYVASAPADIPENLPLPPQDAIKIWAGDRHIIVLRAQDYNDLVNHVKRECNDTGTSD